MHDIDGLHGHDDESASTKQAWGDDLQGAGPWCRVQGAKDGWEATIKGLQRTTRSPLTCDNNSVIVVLKEMIKIDPITTIEVSAYSHQPNLLEAGDLPASSDF